MQALKQVIRCYPNNLLSADTRDRFNIVTNNSPSTIKLLRLVAEKVTATQRDPFGSLRSICQQRLAIPAGSKNNNVYARPWSCVYVYEPPTSTKNSARIMHIRFLISQISRQTRWQQIHLRQMTILPSYGLPCHQSSMRLLATATVDVF